MLFVGCRFCLLKKSSFTLKNWERLFFWSREPDCFGKPSIGSDSSRRSDSLDGLGGRMTVSKILLRVFHFTPNTNFVALLWKWHIINRLSTTNNFPSFVEKVRSSWLLVSLWRMWSVPEFWPCQWHWPTLGFILELWRPSLSSSMEGRGQERVDSWTSF